MVFGYIPGSVYQSVAYRYDGSHWHKIPVPRETAVQGAVALGPNNVWAFGSTATIFAPGSHVSATVFHWNGTGWHDTGLPRVLNDIPGVSVFSAPTPGTPLTAPTPCTGTASAGTP